MKPRIPLLVVTHLGCAALAFAVARYALPLVGPGAAPPPATATRAGRERQPTGGDGKILLEAFLHENSPHVAGAPAESAVLKEKAAADLAAGLAGLMKDPANEKRPRTDLVQELLRTEVNRFLSSGRDWCYDFRNGEATLDEVLQAARAAIPAAAGEGDNAMRISLFRSLAEENPGKALPLLATLPEAERRQVLFDSTWRSFVNVSPAALLGFSSALPPPETATERDLRTKGWNWKARGFLGRFGDDYVEWVKEMPPGIDKTTAMNSLIWATREVNPTQARKLNDELFPPKKP